MRLQQRMATARACPLKQEKTAIGPKEPSKYSGGFHNGKNQLVHKTYRLMRSIRLLPTIKEAANSSYAPGRSPFKPRGHWQARIIRTSLLSEGLDL